MTERRSLVPIILAALTVGIVTCGPAMTTEDLDCLEAIEHFHDCCPGAEIDEEVCDRKASSWSCVPEFSWGSPGLSAETSKCIKRKSCAQLVADKTCESTKTLLRSERQVPQCR